MRYSAYTVVAGMNQGQVVSRDTAQARSDLITAFATQLQEGRTTLTLPVAEEFTEARRIGVVRNEAAAMFTVELAGGYRLHVLAQSGYITGLTNSADYEMLGRLRDNLHVYGQGWEPDPSVTPIDPPAYYSVLEPSEPSKAGVQGELLNRLFPLAEALAIAFFFTIRLDGPDAYEWEDSDQTDEP